MVGLLASAAYCPAQGGGSSKASDATEAKADNNKSDKKDTMLF